MEETLSYAILSIFFVILAIKLLTRKQRKNLPPSPPALPIIGHLHLLKRPLYRVLHNLSQKYGPVMLLRLGAHQALIVSSPAAVEEVFTKNDITFANRPQFLLGKHVNYNNSTLGSSNYGDHWRNLRRISTVEIFSPSRLDKFEGFRKDEVNILLGRLFSKSRDGFTKVVLRPMFFDLTTNVIMRMVAGKRFPVDVKVTEEGKELRELTDEFFSCVAKTNLGDLFPIFQKFDYNGYVKKLVRLGERFDVFLQKMVDEQRIAKDRSSMINHLLALQETQPDFYSDENIKGLIMVMLLGGAETAAVSIEWTMANMLNNPTVLVKAKAELDSVIGKDRLMEESDLPKLNYLQSIILESLRLCPVTPLIPSHFSSSDCTIEGFHVPANTMLFVNAWAIHRDPNVWDDPTSFKPERFENEKFERFRFLPFGLGRRACPGEGLAKKEMGLALGSMIQCFEWKKVDEEEIDMTEKGSITMHKAEPLEVMCQPRPILHKFLSQA